MKELRSRTAEFMRGHADDFLPFLTNSNTGDMYTTGNALIFVFVIRNYLLYFKEYFNGLVWILQCGMRY